jgi:hypothetical protein
MELSERIAHVRTRDDLVAFVEALRADHAAAPAAWTNGGLGEFLEAIAAWLADMEGYYANQGKPPPDPPSWQTFAEILLAAKHYE